jgi:subtilase family serine protease
MQKKKIVPFLGAALLVSSLGSSQVGNAQTLYAVQHVSGTWTEITSGGTVHTPVAYGGLSAWDEGYATIPLPFTFTWYGNPYSTIYAYSNGFVSFSPPPLGETFLTAPSVVPSPLNRIHNFIGVMWADLDGGASPEIRSVVSGSIGDRIFTVQLRGLRAFSNPNSAVAFQVRLYEATNKVEVIMGPNNGVGQSGTTAAEDFDGGEGMNLMTVDAGCTGVCTCTPGQCGSLNWQPTGRTITIELPTDPELTGEVSAPPGAFPGTQFDALVRVRNLGLSPTAAFRYQLRLTQTNTSTAGSTLLETVNVPGGLAAATTLTSTRTLTMPANAGVADYYVALIIDLDDDIDEVIESNNVVYTPDAVSTAPDLLGYLFAPTDTGPGEQIDVTLNVQSAGAPVSAPVNVAFYLSADQIWDAADFPMGTDLIAMPDGFAGTDSFTLDVPVNAPPSPPFYYVLALLDAQDVVDETNESNNTAVSGQIVLDGPDLEAVAIDAGPFAFLGLGYPVTATIRNSGGATARDFTVCVLISENLLISVIGDPTLLQTAPMTLLPGEEIELVLQPVIPANTSTGAWYVAAVADCTDVVLESQETDNVRRRNDAIGIRSPVPDFTPLEISTATAAAAGETIPVSARIGNIGYAPGSAIVRFVISRNVGPTISDPTIYETPAAITLDENLEATVSAWAEIPSDLGSGLYNIGVIVDPANALEEVYEDNNVLASRAISVAGANVAIVTPNPPNAVIGVPYTRRFAAVGGTGDYTWTIQFQRGSPPEGLSFDPTTAELSGTPSPSAEGRHDFSVTVSSGNINARRNYTLLVSQPTIPLAVVSSRLPPALRLEPYEIQLIAIGGTPPYLWEVLAGEVPLGLTLFEDGTLGGEPQDGEDAYTFTVGVTDSANIRAEGVIAVDVVDTNVSVTITLADIPSTRVGEEYEVVFTVSGGTIPYNWRIELDRQIPGITFDPQNASLTGSATIAGDYPMIVEVRDAFGFVDRNAYVLRVDPAGDLVIATGGTPSMQLPGAILGQEYRSDDGGVVQIRAVRRSGGDPGRVLWTIVDGGLPPGLALDDRTGEITGTPATEGNFPFRVLLTNDAGDFAFAALVIEVVSPVTIEEGQDDGCGCTASNSDRSSWWAVLALFAGAALLRGRRSLRVMVMVLGAVFASPQAHAQVVPYQVLQESAPYTQLTGAVEVFPGLSDGTTVAVPLPFTFYLYGEPANTVFINANGFFSILNVGPGHHYPPQNNPDPFGAHGFVAPLWDDWVSSADFGPPFQQGIGVFYTIDPVEGSMSIEWRHVHHFSDNQLASDINFKATLYEGLASRVEFTYGPMAEGIAFGFPTFFAARIGLQNSTASDGMWIGPCSGTSPCAFPALDALENQKLTVVADAGDDVAITSVSVPSVGFPNLPLEVAARLISRHGEALGPTSVAAYLIPASATSTLGAVQLYAGEPVVLGPFESRSLEFSFDVPNDVPVGNYRVAVLADHLHQLDETDEDNNLSISIATVRIADRAPDFRILRVRALTDTLAPGGSLSIAYTVQNFGNEPGAMRLQAYLSANDAISTTDLVFGIAVSSNTSPREVITGTITANIPSSLSTGTYWVGLIADETLAVPELSESNNVGRSTDPVTVSAANVVILTSALPAATLGVAYSANVRAAGGNGAFTYRLAGGTLPRGTNFDASEAEIFGIPLEVGSFPLEIEARSNNVIARETLTMEVLDPTLPLTILSSALPAAVLGGDYSGHIRFIGGEPPFVWRITEGTLPRGLLLGTDGYVFGQPSAVGSTSFVVELRDNLSMTATRAFTIDTRSPGNLSIVTSNLAEGTVGEPYNELLDATGGTGEIDWQAVSEPPPGLLVDGTGAIRGIPERGGQYAFRVRAIDQLTGVEDTNVLRIDIAVTGRLAISTDSLPEARPEQTDYSVSIKAEGGKRPYTWEIDEGGLPPEMEAAPRGADMQELEIRRSPMSPTPDEGVWTFTVRVWDGEGRLDEKPFALIIRNPLPEPTTMTIEDEGCGCNATKTSSPMSALWFLALGGLSLLRGARSRKTAGAMLAALLSLSTGVAEAQVYIQTQYPSPYTPLSAGTPVAFDNEDDGATLVPIGFTFTYYGLPYTHVNVGVNSAMSFALPCGPSSTCSLDGETCNLALNVCERESIRYDPTGPFPNDADVPHNVVAPFWDDMLLDPFVTPTGLISTGITGTAPNREFVIQWSDIRHYYLFGSSTLSRANYQVRLSESSGAVRLSYGPYLANAFDDVEWSGYPGIENANGTEGFAAVNCGGLECDYTVLQSLTDQVIEFSAPNAPELLATLTTPGAVNPGETMDITLELINVGPLPAATQFFVDIYLSQDNTITTADTFLTRVTVANLAEQSVVNIPVQVTIDALTPIRTYRVGAIVDATNTIAEAVETNNTALNGRLLLVGGDVRITFTDTVPTDSGPNEQLTVPIRLLNYGSAIDDVPYSIYFSIDGSYDSSDILLATGDVDLPAGLVSPVFPSETIVNATGTVPSTINPGDYYLIAFVDPANIIPEADESNNTIKTDNVVTLTGPDVVSVSITGEQFVFAGEPYTVSYVVENRGASTASDFYVSFHLSDNQLVTFSDHLIAEAGPYTLAPGASQTIVETYTISSTLAFGAYFLGVIADDRTTIREQNETNNVRFLREPVTVRDVAPDFTVSTIILPDNAAAGESFMLQRTLSNPGNAPATLEYMVYLSQDATIDPATDYALEGGSLALNEREENTGTDNVRIPARVPGGNYYVGYSVDPNNLVSELFEDNNIAVSRDTIAVVPAQLMILTRTLPIATVDLPYTFVLAAAGGAGAYVWTLESGALPVGLALDASGRISGTPTEEGTSAFTLSVSDGSLSVAADYTLLVAEQTLPLELATASLVLGFVGREYNYPLTAFGGVPPYSWTARDALPAGLTLTPDGLLTGVPSLVSVNTVDFNVTDATGETAERPLVVRIVSADAAVRFAADVLPDGTFGEPYDENVRVEPGTGESPFVFEHVSGELPPGLTLDQDRLAGLPTAVGRFTFGLRVSDNRGDFDLNLFIVDISEAAGITISTTSLPSGTTGVEYRDEGGVPVRIKAFASGRTEAVISYSIASGALPPGLELTSDGVLQGTPTASGVYAFLLVANDDAGQIDRRALGVLIEDPPIDDTTPAPEEGCGCKATSSSSNVSWLALGALGVLLLFRRRGAFVAILALAVFPSIAEAQMFGPYFLTTRSELYVARSGGTPLNWFSNDDDFVAVTLPFGFRHYGSTYTEVLVSTNGIVSFDVNTFLYGGNEPIPSTFEPNAYIAAFWDDLIVGTGTTLVEGTAPNRVFIIQYENVTRYNTASGSTEFQIRLYEGLGGKVEVAYGTGTNLAAAGWEATAGLEDETGSSGFYFFGCGSACDGSQLQSLPHTVVVAQQDAGEDIIPGAISGPPIVYAGVDFPIDLTLASFHNAPLGPFRYEVHLVDSTNGTPNNPIFRSEPITLTNYQSLSVQMNTAVPLSTLEGRYRLALVVDSDEELAEPDENNVIYSEEFRVAPPQPDFIVSEVSPAAPTGQPGSSLSITTTFENVGNLDGAAAYRLYLSRNSVISTDDLEVASGSIDLPLLTTSSVTTNIALAASLVPGNYWIGAVIDGDNAVRELSEVNNVKASLQAVVISSPELAVSTTELPIGYANTDYNTYLSATGGDGDYAWTITSGTLPAGLNLIGSTGQIRGLPGAPATANITVQVASASQTATQNLTLEIHDVDAGLSIITRDLFPGIVGASYPPDEQRIVAIGGSGELTYSLTGEAPAGLVLDSDGLLHGIPEQRGVFELMVNATDGTATASRTLLLTVGEPGRLAIVAAILPNAVLGENYDYQFRTIGQSSTATLTFDTTDTLPPGIEVREDGRIFGSAEAAGSWRFAVTVSEGQGVNVPKDTAIFVLDVTPEAGFRINPTTLPNGEIGTAYLATLNVVGGTPPFAWRLVGELPKGLVSAVQEQSDQRQALVVQGTPEELALVTVLVRVDDGFGRFAEEAIALRVLDKPTPEPTLTDDSGCGCRGTRGGMGNLAAFLVILAGFAISRRRPSGSR